ncbi:MAG: SGNH/GDSL hydrolase family protein [Planctomycetaceae bacterium]|nr:SGNH/GDSL hydrolase family protein [Planctomycetaceae bacterium]
MFRPLLQPALAVALCGVVFSAPLYAQDAKAQAKTKRVPNPALAKIEDDPKLPRVLLIGDSISIGYTLAVRDLLKGKANVHRIPTNAGPTTNGLKNLSTWLGDGQWDVIHFNWGLHDLKYIGANDTSLADPKAPGSRPQVPPAEYEANLRELVKQLQGTKAQLIWCATTPVPEGSNGRVAGDEAPYNTIAAKVMQDAGVTTNDLGTFAKARLADIQLPKNVHFSDPGSKVLAEEVAKAIAGKLAKR